MTNEELLQENKGLRDRIIELECEVIRLKQCIVPQTAPVGNLHLLFDDNVTMSPKEIKKNWECLVDNAY